MDIRESVRLYHRQLLWPFHSCGDYLGVERRICRVFYGWTQDVVVTNVREAVRANLQSIFKDCVGF